MANSILSPNMSLPVPVIGVDPGPDWASNINASLSILDGHNHASGSGVPITPAGINISADLPFLSNNAVSLRSARFSSQSSPLSLPTDLACVYVSNGNLYYNNASGLQIQLTNASGIAGTSGSISNLVSPASVNFLSTTGTYQFLSNAGVAGNLDGGSIILRPQTAGAPGLTLSPPSSISSNYSLVFPTIPTAKSLMTLDASGNMGSIVADNSTISFASGTLQVPAQGITTAQIANSAVTNTQIASGTITADRQVLQPAVTFTFTNGTYANGGSVGVSITSFGTFVPGRTLVMFATGEVTSTANVQLDFRAYRAIAPTPLPFGIDLYLDLNANIVWPAAAGNGFFQGLGDPTTIVAFRPLMSSGTVTLNNVSITLLQV